MNLLTDNDENEEIKDHFLKIAQYDSEVKILVEVPVQYSVWIYKLKERKVNAIHGDEQSTSILLPSINCGQGSFELHYLALSKDDCKVLSSQGFINKSFFDFAYSKNNHSKFLQFINPSKLFSDSENDKNVFVTHPASYDHDNQFNEDNFSEIKITLDDIFLYVEEGRFRHGIHRYKLMYSLGIFGQNSFYSPDFVKKLPEFNRDFPDAVSKDVLDHRHELMSQCVHEKFEFTMDEISELNPVSSIRLKSMRSAYNEFWVGKDPYQKYQNAEISKIEKDVKEFLKKDYALHPEFDGQSMGESLLDTACKIIRPEFTHANNYYNLTAVSLGVPRKFWLLLCVSKLFWECISADDKKSHLTNEQVVNLLNNREVLIKKFPEIAFCEDIVFGEDESIDAASLIRPLWAYSKSKGDSFNNTQEIVDDVDEFENMKKRFISGKLNKIYNN